MRPRTARSGVVLACSFLLSTATFGTAWGQRTRVVSVTSPAEQIDLNSTEPLTPLSPFQQGTEVRRQRVGSFTVLEETYRLPAGQPRPIHGRSESTTIHLSFDTPDRRVNLALTDDGSKLSASAQSPGCSVNVNYLQYARSDEEWRLFEAMLNSLDILAERCEKGLEAVGEYRRLLDTVKPGFPAAVRVMKDKVSKAFGGRMERCEAPEPSELPVIEFHPGPC